MHKILIGGGVLVAGAVVLVSVAIGALFLVDWNSFRKTIAERASATTGRQVEMRGDLDVVISWRPELRARDLVIANADWGSKPEMVHADDVYFQFRVWPLLRGRLEIDSMRLVGLDVLLEQQKDRANWEFQANTPEGTVVKAVAPKGREGFPVLRELVIENAKLTYRGPSMKQPIETEFARLEAHGGSIDDPVTLAMKGTYQKSPFNVTADLGSFSELRAGSQAYPVKARIDAGATSASFQGTISEPLEFQGVDGTMSLKGKNLDELYKLLGVPLPQSPRYQLTGKLSEQSKTWSVNGFKGALGSSDMHGDVAVNTGGERPHMTAKVTSTAVDMADIEGFWAAKPEQPGSTKGEHAAAAPPKPRAEDAKADTKPAEAAPVVPEEPIRLDKMRAMDVDLDFQGKSIKSSGPALDNINVKLKLVDGKAVLQPFELGIFKGRVAGNLTLDGSQKVPALSGDVRLQDVQLGSLLQATGLDDKSVGSFRGAARIRTNGGTLHQLLANMDGDGTLLMEGGQISRLLLELIALDLPKAIATWMRGNTEVVKITCLGAPFTAHEGDIVAKPWVFDTDTALVEITGDIDLRNERTRMELLPHPKDFSFFNLLTSITIEGDLKTRRADVNKLDAIAKVLLKTLTSPFMPVVSPPLEEETRAQHPCDTLIAKLQEMQKPGAPTSRAMQPSKK
jgi:uncharacterized protein involved in outer membrane biogenesis